MAFCSTGLRPTLLTARLGLAVMRFFNWLDAFRLKPFQHRTPHVLRLWTVSVA